MMRIAMRSYKTLYGNPGDIKNNKKQLKCDVYHFTLLPNARDKN